MNNRVKRIKDPFKILLLAANKSVQPMWKAAQVLIYITCGLIIIFYIFEAFAQPKNYGNFLNCIVWAFSQYIGDPGNFAGPGPITFMGRIIAEIIGILKILIFAVPAGMIGTAYANALKEDKRREELRRFNRGIHTMFHRFPSHSVRISKEGGKGGEMVRMVPRYKSLETLEVELLLKRDDIIDTINSADDIRLCNLASSLPSCFNPQDKLVVQLIPLKNRKKDSKYPYGCFIDRHSRITIVAPNSYKFIGVSSFAFYLAKFGGFNFISKEFVPEPGLDEDYYFIRKKVWDELQAMKDADDNSNEHAVKTDAAKNNLFRYLDDIEKLTHTIQSGESWVIFILGTNVVDANGNTARLDIQTNTNNPDIQSTVDQKETFDTLVQDIAEIAKSDNFVFEINSDLFVPMKNTVAPRLAHEKFMSNSFCMRFSNHLLLFNNDPIKLVWDFAEAMKRNLEPKENKRISWTSPGYGYLSEDFMSTDELKNHKDNRSRKNCYDK